MAIVCSDCLLSLECSTRILGLTVRAEHYRCGFSQSCKVDQESTENGGKKQSSVYQFLYHSLVQVLLRAGTSITTCWYKYYHVLVQVLPDSGNQSGNAGSTYKCLFPNMFL